MTGFYIKSYTVLEWVNKKTKNFIYTMIYRPHNGNIKTLTLFLLSFTLKYIA